MKLFKFALVTAMVVFSQVSFACEGNSRDNSSRYDVKPQERNVHYQQNAQKSEPQKRADLKEAKGTT